MRILFIILSSFLVAGCKQKVTVEPPQYAERGVKRRFAEKPSSYYYTYDKGKYEVDNFSQGYVDTFTANGSHFQLFSNPDSSNDLELQVLVNGKWVTNMKTPYGFHGNEVVKDFNGDGFDDYRVSLLRGTQVYLFDAAKESFHPEPIHIGFEWNAIDRDANLFCDAYSDRFSWQTNLFRLEGFHQQVLYYADIEMVDDTARSTGHLKLYKVDGGSNDTLLVFEKEMDLLKTDFDYRKFWKDFIQNGYR